MHRTDSFLDDTRPVISPTYIDLGESDIAAISHRHILSEIYCNINNICQKYFVSICLGAVKKSKHGGEVEKNRYLRFVRTPNL